MKSSYSHLTEKLIALRERASVLRSEIERIEELRHAAEGHLSNALIEIEEAEKAKQANEILSAQTEAWNRELQEQQIAAATEEMAAFFSAHPGGRVSLRSGGWMALA